MRKGGCKQVLFTLHIPKVELEDMDVTYHVNYKVGMVGIIRNGELQPFSEEVMQEGMIEVVDKWKYTYDDPPHRKSPITVIPIRTSPEIPAGKYKLYIKLKVKELGINTRVPLTIKVKKSPDDVIRTPGGPCYRTNVHGRAMKEWPPVKEKKVKLEMKGGQR